MNSFTASLELWLKLQCQMHPKVTQAFIVSTDGDNHQWLARWPTASAPQEFIIEAARQVAVKKRTYLQKLDSYMLLGQPVLLNGNYFGAVVLQLADSNSQDIKQAVEQLSRGLVWLQFLLYDYAKTSSSHNPAPGDTLPLNAPPTPLIEKLLKENSPQEAAISLVNVLATQLQSTRVSLGWQTARGISLDAVSFSANFDQRTHAMQLLVEVMNEAADQGTNIYCAAQQAEPLSGAEQLPNAATHITRNHQLLLAEQSLQSVYSFLLRKEQRILGAIVMENAQAQAFNAEQQTFIQAHLPLISHILDLKKSAHSGLWQKLKQLSLLQASRWFGHQHPLLNVLGVALVAFFAVLFISTDYHVSSEASLKSAYKHLLVSPQDGYLKIIKARPGDLVKKGELLAQLNDDELGLQRRKLASQAQQYRQEYDAALANSNRVAAAIANTQIDQANIQLRLVEQQLERIHLLAPNDGMVVSDDISQTLGAPVKQGDLLFEIAAVRGYLVQLMVDERDIAALAVGQSGYVKLTSLPHDVFEFRVKTITPISEILNGRNYFRVEASLLDETQILRPGMTGTGKITAGKRSLGWIWFHDLWHWLSLKFWW